MSKDKKEESFKEIKSKLREELNDLYDRYGLDMVKLVVDEDDLHKTMQRIEEKRTSFGRNQTYCTEIEEGLPCY